MLVAEMVSMKVAPGLQQSSYPRTVMMHLGGQGPMKRSSSDGKLIIN
jgi:hypothetical protein